MSDSILTILPNGGSEGWDEMCLGYDGDPITFPYGWDDVLFSLGDTAAAGAISKIAICYRIETSTMSERKSYVEGSMKVSGTMYYTPQIYRVAASPTWYYVDVTTNPATSEAWEWDEIDSLSAGIRSYIGVFGVTRMYQYKVLVYYSPETYADTSLGSGIVGSGGTVFV